MCVCVCVCVCVYERERERERERDTCKRLPLFTPQNLLFTSPTVNSPRVGQHPATVYM